MSFNRETKRIVGDLQMPGRSLEQLLEVLTFRRADGREISLDEFPLAQALSSATTVRAEEIVIEVPDGRSVTTVVNATPIRAEGGEVESVVVTLQDMTPLEELERLRAEFLGMVSHELRAPLTSVKGCAATVLGAAPALDPAEMLQFFRIIDEQADHMRNLISDLLDAGRIETGTLSVAPAPAEVAGLVDQARNTFLSGGGRNPIRIDLPPDLPRVLADRRRIVQVLSNLFSNASRSSPDSSAIRVTAMRRTFTWRSRWPTDGRGVPADRLPTCSGSFPGSTARTAGAGSGGRAWAWPSARGWWRPTGAASGPRATERAWARGSPSRFRWPNKPGRAPPPAAPGPCPLTAGRGPGDARPCGGRRPADAAVRAQEILAEAGYSPLVTGDPEEVPRLIEAHRPQLVLLDLMLPGTDGIELMERVPALADMPVIFLSAYGRDQIIARAFEIGAADYVVKPFSPTELVARIQAALRRRAEPPAPYRLGDLAIYYDERRVTVAGRAVQLTATEYDLLRELAVNAGRVSRHEDLLRGVGFAEHGRPPGAGSFVKKLRRKLGDDASNPAYIRTEPRVGYRMARLATAEDPPVPLEKGRRGGSGLFPGTRCLRPAAYSRSMAARASDQRFCRRSVAPRRTGIMRRLL